MPYTGIAVESTEELEQRQYELGNSRTSLSAMSTLFHGKQRIVDPGVSGGVAYFANQAHGAFINMETCSYFYEPTGWCQVGSMQCGKSTWAACICGFAVGLPDTTGT